MLLLLPLLLAVSLPPAPLLAGPLPPQGGGPDRWEDRWELRCSPVRHSWTALSMYFLLLSRIYVTLSIGFISLFFGIIQNLCDHFDWLYQCIDVFFPEVL